MNKRKIYHSLDFRNNKLLNAKTETPIEPEHITNKKYVDDMTTYDTPKAELYKNPFKFGWIKDVFNKPYKQLFDDLLFPRILPDYFNPVFGTVQSVRFDKTQDINDKMVMLSGLQYKGKIIITHTPNDRIATSVARIKYTQPNGTILTWYSNSTDNQVSTFDVDFPFVVGSTYEFSLDFNPSIIMKQDTYGDDYRPAEFNQSFTLVKDITDLFNGLVITEHCMFVRKKANDTPASIVDGSVYTLADILNAGFANSNYMPMVKDTWGYWDLLVPTELFNRYELWLANEINTTGKINNKIDLEKQYIIDTESVVNTTISGVKYVVCNVNLGMFRQANNFRIMLDDIFIS